MCCREHEVFLSSTRQTSEQTTDATCLLMVKLSRAALLGTRKVYL